MRLGGAHDRLVHHFIDGAVGDGKVHAALGIGGVGLGVGNQISLVGGARRRIRGRAALVFLLIREKIGD